MFSMPNSIFIEITSKCNMDCVFCPFGVMKRERQHMPHELVMKALNDIVNLRIDDEPLPPVTFHCMGEPFLNPHFNEYLSFCDEHGIGYWVVSNGLLLTESNCTKFFNHTGLDHLEVSFHTICDRTLKLRGVKQMNFETYSQKIKRAVFNPIRIQKNTPIQLDVMYDRNLEEGKIFDAFNDDEWNTFTQLMLTWKEEFEKANPEAVEKNHSFYKSRKKVFDLGEYIIYRNLEDIPKDFFNSLPNRVNWISWEVFPKVFVVIKKFFIFSPNNAYYSQILSDRATVDIEEASGFKCNLAKSLVILSNGEITFCCLDYEGVLSCGNLANMSLKDALESNHRSNLINKPDDFAYCRVCFGKKTYNWKIEHKNV